LKAQREDFEKYASNPEWRQSMVALNAQIVPLGEGYDAQIQKLEGLKKKLEQFVEKKQKQILHNLDRVHVQIPQKNLPENLGPLTPLNQRLHPFGSFQTPTDSEKTPRLVNLRKRTSLESFQTPVGKKVYAPPRRHIVQNLNNSHETPVRMSPNFQALKDKVRTLVPNFDTLQR